MKDLNEIDLVKVNGGAEGCDGCRFGARVRLSWEAYKAASFNKNVVWPIWKSIWN